MKEGAKVTMWHKNIFNNTSMKRSESECDVLFIKSIVCTICCSNLAAKIGNDNVTMWHNNVFDEHFFEKIRAMIEVLICYVNMYHTLTNLLC